jgi:flagellar basal-body rod protein FlgC
MSLFDSISIAATGMAAQRMRAQLLTENIANAETTRTDAGGPYQRKDVVFRSSSIGESRFAPFLSDAMRPAGVSVSEIVVDDRQGEMRYLPGHPDADEEGYVAFPHISPAEEMVDLMNSARSYHANVAAISAVKDMIARSIEILR